MRGAVAFVGRRARTRAHGGAMRVEAQSGCCTSRRRRCSLSRSSSWCASAMRCSASAASWWPRPRARPAPSYAPPGLRRRRPFVPTPHPIATRPSRSPITTPVRTSREFPTTSRWQRLTTAIRWLTTEVADCDLSAPISRAFCDVRPAAAYDANWVANRYTPPQAFG